MSKFEVAFAAWIAFHSELGVNIEATLKPPATEDEIKAVENKLGFDLPDDIRELYKKADGQYDPWDHGEELEARLAPNEYWAPLFGNFALIPLDQAFARYVDEAEWRKSESEFTAKYNEANPDKVTDNQIVWQVRAGDPVDPGGWNPDWFIFAWTNADSLALDMNPPHGGTPGQVVEFGPDVARLSVLGSSLTDLLEEAAYRLDVDEPNRYQRSEGDVRTLFFDMDWRNRPYDEQDYLDSIPQMPIEYTQWQEEEQRKEELRISRFAAWLNQQGFDEEDFSNVEFMFRSDLNYRTEIPDMPVHVFDAMNTWSIDRGDGPMPESHVPDDEEIRKAIWYRYYMGMASEVLNSATESGKHISSSIGHGMLRQNAIALIHKYFVESGEWTRSDYEIAEALRKRFSTLEIILQGESGSYSMGFEGSVLEICWSTFDSETYKSEDFCDHVDISEYRN